MSQLCAFLFSTFQLRVVRAFKSTLEEVEEKRSVQSVHSFHSLRSSRSHQGHRPLSDELLNPTDIGGRTPSPGTEASNGFHNMGMVIHENKVFGGGGGSSRASSIKSRSVENVALLDGCLQGATPTVVIQGTDSSPRTMSLADVSLHYETIMQQ